jgi:hypothetical protein
MIQGFGSVSSDNPHSSVCKTYKNIAAVSINACFQSSILWDAYPVKVLMCGLMCYRLPCVFSAEIIVAFARVTQSGSIRGVK